MKQRNQKTPDQSTSSAKLKQLQSNVRRQALLAIITLILAVVILFAITAAWYTNIVQTNGLVFEASQWGFEGTVTVDDTPIQAAPGDEGVIALTAQNTGDTLTAVGVNVSKANMSAEMQKRLYFYVDAQKTKNGEQMNRVYLTNTGSYTYTLFSQGTLELTEQYHNDAQLKWQWVYDVLGYYVRGTMASGTMIVEEYLRPIEYDYDAFSTTFVTTTDENGVVTLGELATIDGSTTKEEFLYQLSLTDGYPGTISGDAENGYYPVEVDANGYGVWAYLCNYSEIELNTIYDTQLGSADQKETYMAVLTVTAQNSHMEPTQIASEAELRTAISAGQDALLELSGDVTLASTLQLNPSQNVMLDLGGHTLSVGTAAIGLNADVGSSLTVYDGAIVGDGGYAIAASGAEVTVNNVDISGVDYAIYVVDNTASASDSKVRIVNSNISTNSVSVFVIGNGSASAQMTQLVIENSVIYSDYIGICGNGTASGTGQWGTDVQIIGSRVSGLWAGVYQPQMASNLTVAQGSIVSGYTGIAVKGGTVQIIDSSVYGTGEQQTPTFGMSGFSDTGDGIYLETNYGYDMLLTVSGNSTVTSTYGYAVQVYEPEAECVSVQISGGYFSSDVSDFLAGGMVCTAEGTGYRVTVGETVTETVTETQAEESGEDESETISE